MTRSFDDLTIGVTDTFGTYAVTRDEVIQFASLYDPQGFHLSDEAAANSLFGKIAASGWHTASMTMRMIVDYWKVTGLDQASQGGIGVDELRWLMPVYPGDTLHCEAEILDLKPSRSKPDRGVVITKTTTLNQNNQPVMTMTSTIMMARPV